MEDKTPNKIEEEIDFEAVAKTPIRWFGLVYPYFLVTIIIAGLFYVFNLDNIARNAVKPLATDTTKMFKDIPMKKGFLMTGVDVKTASQATPATIDKGAKLFSANCASCHGSAGKGDGVAGAALTPKPRNLTVKDGWTIGRKLADIYKTLELGSPGTAMAAYEYMPVEDRFALIHFVQSLMPDIPANTPEELATLDQTFSISKGKLSPNQIPIALAVAKMTESGKIEEQDLLKIETIIKAHSGDEGYEIFDRVVSNKFKAIYTLYSNGDKIVSNSDFIQVISAGAPVNGFKPTIATLDSEDLTALRAFLAKFLTIRFGAV